MDRGEWKIENGELRFFLINAPLVLNVCLAGHCPVRHYYQPVSAKTPG